MLNPRIMSRIKASQIETLRAKVGRIARGQPRVELAEAPPLAEASPLVKGSHLVKGSVAAKATPVAEASNLARAFAFADLLAKGFPPSSPAAPETSPFLPGGLPAGCIHEIEGASWDAETGVAASAFAAALLGQAQAEARGGGAILWAVRQDTPFAPRLAAFGLEADRVIFCRCGNDAETLAALEDALRTEGIAAALGEVEQVTLTQSRRLHLICERAGNAGLLLRRRFHGAPAFAKHRGTRAQGSAAATRWRIHFAPTQTVEPGLGPPRWRLDLLYCRGGMPASFIVEWNDEARHLHLVAKLADHQAQPDQRGLRRAG